MDEGDYMSPNLSRDGGWGKNKGVRLGRNKEVRLGRNKGVRLGER